MSFRKLKYKHVNTTRSSEVLRAGEVAVEGTSLYVGDGVSGGTQIGGSSPFEIHTQSTRGSTDSGNPLELPADKDMYIFHYPHHGNITHFSLPDGTTVGQTVKLCVPYSHNLGSAPRIHFTRHDGSSDIGLTGNGSRNMELVWTGTYWIFTNYMS